MALTLGKKWESKVVECWEKSLPNSFLLRLPDQQSGYKHTSGNISDFIGFVDGKLYLIECKTTKGNTLPLVNLHQYEKLLSYRGLKGIYIGFLVWWNEKDKVAWIPIDTVTQLKEENKKSIHIDILDKKEYNTLEIPAVKKRTYMDCDFSVLREIENENSR